MTCNFAFSKRPADRAERALLSLLSDTALDEVIAIYERGVQDRREYAEVIARSGEHASDIARPLIGQLPSIERHLANCIWERDRRHDS